MPFVTGIQHEIVKSQDLNILLLLLNRLSMAVLTGEGGETERNPDMDCLVQSVKNNELQEEQWPALFLVAM